MNLILKAQEPQVDFASDFVRLTLARAIARALCSIAAQKSIDIGTEDTVANSINLEYPAIIEHGDFASNAALAYAKKIGSAPQVLARAIVDESSFKELVKKVRATAEVAGPGFINFKLSQEFFAETIHEIVAKSKESKFGMRAFNAGKKVLVEYTDPNPFKVFHIGHLMSNALGEAVSRLVEFSGAHVVRANYQGDVGLHVAKAIWGMMALKDIMPPRSASVKEISDFIGTAYVKGSAAENDDPQAKAEIAAINKKVFERSDAAINDLYDWGRSVTLLNFEEIYKLVGTHFDRYFFESEVAQKGFEVVRSNTPAIFKESEGAVVFPGEKYGLHTRVFITSQGLPTYEAKEIGLTHLKFAEINPDLSIVVTANEQNDYFKVVLKALSLVNDEMAAKTQHISHGMLRFASGKMSSRTGNVITGESLLEDVREMVRTTIADRELTQEEKNKVADDVGVAAIKLSILKQATGSDIIYDPQQSISFEGDSGPYLQYSTVRARAILQKAEDAQIKINDLVVSNEAPTYLERIMHRFPSVIDFALEEMEPHLIATYLLELAGAFNAFYAQSQIVKAGDPQSAYRVLVTKAFYEIMSSGLYILGIRIPLKM